MDSKESDDEESPSIRTEMLLTLRQKIEKASNLHDLEHIANELQHQLLNTTPNKNAQDPSKEELSVQIHEIVNVFVAEEVGHSCDLCQRDLARDPERPSASLRRLQEVCVLSCGHVYHFNCLRGTTPDLDNHSTDPSCIFCISHSN